MNSKRNIFSNLMWKFMERSGAQGVAFIVSIILARLLEPEIYGTIALVTVFTTILNVFVDSGFANALIQKKNADDLDFSTVFYFNIFVCLCLYCVMFFSAPAVANFYGTPVIKSIIRVLSLTVVIYGIKNVQQAYVSRTMQFKKFFFSTLGGTIGGAVVGIVMAFLGFGVWALVSQQLFNATTDTIILWGIVKWRPKKMFSLKRLKGLFDFGWKLLISALIETVYNNIRQLIIGKLYTSADLAYYNRGRQLPDVIVTSIDTSINSVLLPVMSAEHENKERLKLMTRRAIKTSTYVMAPMMMGLAAVGTPLINLLLTEKWLPCVPYMRIFCIAFMFWPIHTANLNAISAMGRSDWFLRLEIYKKIVASIILVSTMWFGVNYLAYGLLVESLLSQIINSWPNKKFLNYSYLEQMKDIFPCISLSILMAGFVYMVQFLKLYDIFTLLIQILLGIAIYFGGSIILKIDSYEYLSGIVKPKLEKNVAR